MDGSAAGQLDGLVVDLPPRELHPNGRAHWRAVAKAKKVYRQQAAELLWGQLQERGLPPPRLTKAVIRLDYYHGRPRRGRLQPQDPDNLLAWAKATIDALQDAEILADDREIIYLPPRQMDTERPRLELSVRELVPGECPLCKGRQGGP